MLNVIHIKHIRSATMYVHYACETECNCDRNIWLTKTSPTRPDMALKNKNKKKIYIECWLKDGRRVFCRKLSGAWIHEHILISNDHRPHAKTAFNVQFWVVRRKIVGRLCQSAYWMWLRQPQSIAQHCYVFIALAIIRQKNSGSSFEKKKKIEWK